MNQIKRYMGAMQGLVQKEWIPYKNRVAVENATVKNNWVSNKYYRLCKENNLPTPVFSWFGEAGTKERVSGIYRYATKLYSMFTPVARYGPELVVNGGFDTNVNSWISSVNYVITWINGELQLVSGVDGNGFLYQEFITKPSTKYKYTFYARKGSLTILKYRVRDITNNADIINPTIYQDGIVTIYFTTPATCLVSRIYLNNDSGVIGTAFFDNVSCVEVLNSLDGSPTDATQTTSTSQPYLSGNIAPNEKLCLKNPNGGSNYMTHPTVSFAANEDWSVQMVFNWNGQPDSEQWVLSNGTSTGFLAKYTINRFGWRQKSDSLFKFSGIDNSRIIGKNTILTLVAKLTTLKVYVNNTLFDTIVVTDSSADFTHIIKGYISLTDSKRFIQGSYSAHIITPAALTPSQVAIQHNFLRSIYPEIPSVTIDNQTWASSNCEMVATPQGSLIAEVQANANVEKAINGDFSGADLTQWQNVYQTTWQIISNQLVITLLESGSAISNRTAVTVGKYYKVTWTYVGGTATGVKYRPEQNSTVPELTVYTPGTYTIYVKASVTTLGWSPSYTSATGGTVIIDNVSIQEIGWSGSQELYDGIYAQTAEAASAVEKITVAADREFNSDTGFWTKDVGTSISGNLANLNYAGSNVNALRRTNLLTVGLYYKYSFIISNYVSGTLNCFLGTSPTLTISANGTYSGYSLCNTSSVVFAPTASGFVGSIDNISIKELGLSDATSIANYTYAAVKAAAMWCHYNNDVAIGSVYGKLYNWFAVKLLQMDIDYYNAANPTTPWGYRTSTSTDFNNAAIALGGSAVAGGKMKVAGTSYFASPNTGADNSSGFTSIGGGLRNNDGTCSSISTSGIFAVVDNSLIRMVLSNTSESILLASGSNAIQGKYLRLIKS